MATVMAWPEIEAFNNARKYTTTHPEILNGQSKVTYKCKVKLHGMNHAVQIHPDGTVVCQSRTTILTPEADNAGFAKWVDSAKSAWSRRKNRPPIPEGSGVIIYGEWVGPGIQKGVALAELPKRVFAVFAARILDSENSLIVYPEQLETLVHGIEDCYTIPWYNRTLTHGSDTRVTMRLDIDWSQTDEELTKITTEINKWVGEVEAHCPFTRDYFQIDGTGEGLVFYPVSHQGYTNFSNLTFKAKGEKHKNIATAKPAQVNPESAANVDAFVSMVLTQARLEQGADVINGDLLSFTKANLGKFLQWIIADVQKEAQDELEASKLDWKQVQKPLGDKARTWYLGKCGV
jgi:hypothetical protein